MNKGPIMVADELLTYLAEVMPHAETLQLSIDDLGDEAIRVRMPLAGHHLRPGGTVSGPTMMLLADVATYLLVLAHVGRVPLAVTTSLNINFMRKPGPGDLIAAARFLKLGKRLAVAEVGLYGDGESQPAAHATLTYSIPA